MPATQPLLPNVWTRSIRPFLGCCRRKLRHLKFVTHDYLHRKIFGCSLWNEEMKHLIRAAAYQKTSPPPEAKSRLVVYMSEGTEFAGLADRLRTMVSAYIIAAENNRTLHIYHDKGFVLQKYLLPNVIDWSISPDEICWGLNHVSFLWFCRKLPRLRHPEKEYHAYALFNLLAPSLNPKLEQKYNYCEIFNALFRPSPHLSHLVEQAMSSIGLQENQFIAIHLRFLSFLEPVEEHDTEATGSPEEQQQVMSAVCAAIDHIHRESGSRHVLLCSDSNRFLQAPHPDYVKILPGEVGHIIKNNGNDAKTDKAFTDLFVMSKARCIYRITGNHIYSGGFALTAAALGGKDLIDLPYKQFQ